MRVQTNTLLTALAIFSLASVCYADPPDTYLIGVGLSLSTSTAIESIGYRKERPLQLSGLKPFGYVPLSAVELFNESGTQIDEAEIFNKIRSESAIRFVQLSCYTG